MSLSSNIALIKANSLALAGRREEAVSSLVQSIDAGSRDGRLLVRKGLLTGDPADLEAAAKSYSSNRAAAFFLALAALKNGDLGKAGEHLEAAEKISPKNMSVKALMGIVRSRSGDVGALLEIGGVLPGATLDIQALALLEIEDRILSFQRSDMGAAEREDTLGGPLGWCLDRLDDLAVWTYWAISLALNIALNMTNKKRRTAWRHVIEGDRLAGLGKKDEAAARYEAALDADPENMEAMESLTAYHIERGGYDKAADYLDKLESGSEHDDEADPMWKRWRADILFFRGQTQSARREYADLAKSFPLDYIIPYREGWCAARTGDAEGARRGFREALGRVNPGLLRERLEKLEQLARKN